MAQEVVDLLWEGPEADEVYDVYMDEEEEKGTEGENEEVDQDALKEVMIHEVEDDSD